MPARRRTPAKAVTNAAVAVTISQQLRKVTRVIDVIPSNDGAAALTKRADQDPSQAPTSYTVERIAGTLGTNARWRFNIPGPMLVVAEDGLPILQDLIWALKEQRDATEIADGTTS